MAEETSVYEYIDIDDLEDKSGIDYSAVHAVYTDTVICAQITMAERFVRSQLKSIPSTATDGMIAATTIMAERFMHILMVKKGHAEPELKALINFYDEVISLMLKKDEYSPVSSIPMQGIDR